MDTMFWVWLAVIAISIIIEIITLDLVSVWFAFGAVVPFILSAIEGVGIEWQIAIFVVVSALLIIFVRKYAQKLLFKNMNTKTNVEALEGRKVRLLEDTDFEKNGSVKINDVVWTAISDDGKLIKQGSLVEIVKVDGNKLHVRETQEPANETSTTEAPITNENTTVSQEESQEKTESSDPQINNTVEVEEVKTDKKSEEDK